MLVLHSVSPEVTRAIGAELARAIKLIPLQQPIVIALNGELGAGKTTLVGGLLHALGVVGAVRSPTYTLIEPYDLSDRSLFHLDLYRLANARDLEMLAPRDLLEPGAVLLVEWAERAGDALPAPDLIITLKYPSEQGSSAFLDVTRRLELQFKTSVGEVLGASLQAFSDKGDVSS